MAVVGSLFASQAEAQRAIGELAMSQFEGLETWTFEHSDGEGSTAPAVDPNHALTDEQGGDILDELDDEEREFFRRGVEDGGVLLVVEVEDERTGALELFLRRCGGRTAVAD